MTPDPDRFQRAIDLIDEANRADPNREFHEGAPIRSAPLLHAGGVGEGRSWPKELLYSHRMSAWIERLAPDAPEALRLAVRAQHIGRWKIPRSDYPMDRAGYLLWRKTLGAFHAGEAGRILIEAGYDEATVQRVQSLIRKERLKSDAGAQALEDAACLVFLETQFAEFAARHDEEKILGILRKTWAKMSDRGHREALRLKLPEEARALMERALG